MATRITEHDLIILKHKINKLTGKSQNFYESFTDYIANPGHYFINYEGKKPVLAQVITEGGCWSNVLGPCSMSELYHRMTAFILGLETIKS